MPEGPEVTYMTDVLQKKFNGSILEKIVVKNKKFKVPKLKEVTKSLPLKIKKISNKGKFVYIELSNKNFLGFTPGMTGHFVVDNITDKFKTSEGYIYNPKHNHIILETNRGNLYFNDPRLFGRFYVYTHIELKDKLKTLGIDLLKKLPETSQKEFNSILGKFSPGKLIADVLLEQKFIAGVGNYIRAEALYKAKISPFREIGSLNNIDKKKLRTALIGVGKRSYESQKKKLHSFNFEVYGNPGVEQVKRKGRTIWWDPKVQK